MRLFDDSATDFDALARDFKWSVPEFFNIAAAVCDRHAQNPRTAASVALYCVKESDKNANTRALASTYSFADLHRLANQLANLLQSLQVEPGDRVAVVLPQCVETAIGHIAAHKLGAVSLPLSVLFGVEALQHRLGDSAARVVITDAEHASRIQSLQGSLPELQHILVTDPDSAKVATLAGGDRLGTQSNDISLVDLWYSLSGQSSTFETLQTRADDPACLIYTSGTTGPPKGALIAHRSMIGNLTGFELSLNLFPQPGDVFFTPADWAWTGGLFDGLLPTLFYGMPVLGHDYRKFTPQRFLELLQEYKVTCGFFPPTALKMVRTVPGIRQHYDLHLRAVMSAGEMVGEELMAWAESELGVVLNEMYGQTEQNYMVGNCVAIMQPKPGSMGKAYPGHRVEVMRTDGSMAETGETGEFVAHRDDAVHFLGYWNQPEATVKKYTGDWFHTGDVGYRDDDGYLWFMGRADDVITSAGYRIGPGEIEDCIMKHDAVLQVAAVGVPDPEGIRGDIVKAFIVLKPEFGGSDRLAGEIKQSVREQLSAHEYPREIEFIDELPMTTTGKVRRIELRER